VWRKNIAFVVFLLLAGASIAAGLQYQNKVATRVEKPAAAWDSTDIAKTVHNLNREFTDAWQQGGLSPTPAADDLTIARRLSLALTGVVPSLEEIRALEAKPADRRLDWWVDHLLSDRRSSDYLAERFARAYVGSENGPFLLFRRRRFVTWLSDQIEANRRYNEIAHELLAGEGLWTNEPAVNFVTVTVTENRPDPIRLAGRTSRALLGMRIDCLQCHDDHLGTIELGDEQSPHGGTQEDFHRLAAFFSDTTLSLSGIREQEKPYEYQPVTTSKTVTIEPGTPYAAELAPQQGLNRERLAAWVTHPSNKPFARAAVNRVWALLFGRPLVTPIDDIPLHGEFPPGLEMLSADFVAHQYDLHRLIRVIARSEPFRRASRADFEITAQHEEIFAAFPLSRLRPEQVAGALSQSCSLKTIDSHSHIVFQIARFLAQNDFVKRYGDMGDDEFVDRGGTIPQRLLMMNGDMVAERTKENPVTNAATHISMFAADDRHAAETAYLAVLTRRPTAQELEFFTQTMQQTERKQAVEDLYWVLLNSTEFSWNH
jgi:hypothetical protein